MRTVPEARQAPDFTTIRYGTAPSATFAACSGPGGRQAFLHNCDWRADTGFGVLEQIMTAPVIVARRISLQFYGPTVAPQLFGGGNKLLHNVSGGIGGVEGSGGSLRSGQPWQSVHDGPGVQHDPLRLPVIIEAPRDAMSDILKSHAGARNLCDNGWLHLIAMDADGSLSWRHQGDLNWSRDEDGRQSASTSGPISACKIAPVTQTWPGAA